MEDGSGCERWREAISAISDGEASHLDPALIDAHINRCVRCEEFRRQLGQTATTTKIVERIAQEDKGSQPTALRWLLAALAATIFAIALPAFLGDHNHGDVHDMRHAGAFAIAYAAGLVIVARRPARARTMFNVAIVLAASLLLSSMVDIIDGTVRPIKELLHVPEAMSLFVLWLMCHRNKTTAGEPARPRLSGLRHPTSVPSTPTW